METNNFPRRDSLHKLEPAERAIWDAMQAVEAMPADPRLTDAVNLLKGAGEKVADFIDKVPTSLENAAPAVLGDHGPKGEIKRGSYVREAYPLRYGLLAMLQAFDPGDALLGHQNPRAIAAIKAGREAIAHQPNEDSKHQESWKGAKREPWILEMTPLKAVPIREWLGLALTRFALGGVTIGEVIGSWMTSPPEPQAPKGITEGGEA